MIQCRYKYDTIQFNTMQQTMLKHGRADGYIHAASLHALRLTCLVVAACFLVVVVVVVVVVVLLLLLCLFGC